MRSLVGLRETRKEPGLGVNKTPTTVLSGAHMWCCAEHKHYVEHVQRSRNAHFDYLLTDFLQKCRTVPVVFLTKLSIPYVRNVHFTSTSPQPCPSTQRLPWALVKMHAFYQPSVFYVNCLHRFSFPDVCLVASLTFKFIDCTNYSTISRLWENITVFFVHVHSLSQSISG